MANQAWTFETLVQASRPTLEQVLVASQAPDFAQLDGYVYDGFNCQAARYIRLPATKFRKAFFQRAGMPYGLNQIVHPDDKNPSGEWNVQMKNGRPVETGFFKVAPVAETSAAQRFARYRSLISLDYNVDPNPRWHLVMRAIYDIVGLPNAGDYNVLLGKAYLRLLPGQYVFASYFVLGRRTPYHRA